MKWWMGNCINLKTTMEKCHAERLSAFGWLIVYTIRSWQSSCALRTSQPHSMCEKRTRARSRIQRGQAAISRCHTHSLVRLRKRQSTVATHIPRHSRNHCTQARIFYFYWVKKQHTNGNSNVWQICVYSIRQPAEPTHCQMATACFYYYYYYRRTANGLHMHTCIAIQMDSSLAALRRSTFFVCVARITRMFQMLWRRTLTRSVRDWNSVEMNVGEDAPKAVGNAKDTRALWSSATASDQIKSIIKCETRKLILSIFVLFMEYGHAIS